MVLELPARKKSFDSSLDEEDKSWLLELATAGRVPAAIRAAAGASTAVIVCQEEGALASSSTSAACCRSLARGLGLDTVLGVLAEDGVVVVMVDDDDVAVVVVGAVDVVVETGLFEADLRAATGASGAPLVVSLALLKPKFAASLLVISETTPLSVPVGVDRMVTSRTRARLMAVGVDLITRRRIRCSPEAVRLVARRASERQTMSFMVPVACRPRFTCEVKLFTLAHCSAPSTLMAAR